MFSGLASTRLERSLRRVQTLRTVVPAPPVVAKRAEAGHANLLDLRSRTGL